MLTCTLVSFFHGSNDGQKGMGLIMLILIGTVPTAYALNRTMPAEPDRRCSSRTSQAASKSPSPPQGRRLHEVTGDPRPAVTALCGNSNKIEDGTYPSLAVLVDGIAKQVTEYGSLAKNADRPDRQRAQRHLPSRVGGDPLDLMTDKESDLNATRGEGPQGTIKARSTAPTKFIPWWVKVVVAIALGLGTMVGWKRVVVTVGEKIGKKHLTYAQGACAEMTAAATIAAADIYGLPVSTTHVLSSGVAGTMAANGSGLQLATIRNIVNGLGVDAAGRHVAVGHAVLPPCRGCSALRLASLVSRSSSLASRHCAAPFCGADSADVADISRARRQAKSPADRSRTSCPVHLRHMGR